MKRNTLGALVGTAVLLSAVAAWSAPLKVYTAGTKSQTVVMCPDCKTKIACAKEGDYFVGLAVNLDNANAGVGQVIVHVQDKDKKPVENAKVVVTVTMPKHEHGSKPAAAKYDAHGRYVLNSNHLGMPGEYRADVAVTVEGGDTVKQAFTFSR